MSSSPDDRYDPTERMPAVRARVPEHVAAGQISTGVIVVTGSTEFVLDFVRNLPRPNIIVARIVLPHPVMPQFIEALSTNMNLYRQRFGDSGLNPLLPPPTAPQEKPAVPATMAAGAKGDSEGRGNKPSTSGNPGRHLRRWRRLGAAEDRRRTHDLARHRREAYERHRPEKRFERHTARWIVARIATRIAARSL